VNEEAMAHWGAVAPKTNKKIHGIGASIVRITAENGRCTPRLKTLSVVIGCSRICSPEVTGF